MPVSLLGLMAIGMFYLATVVVGLCANRCLAKEDEDEEQRESTSREVTQQEPALKREYSAEVELLNLLEMNVTPVSPISTSTTITPLGDAQSKFRTTTDELHLMADHLHTPSTSTAGVYAYSDNINYSPTCNSTHRAIDRSEIKEHMKRYSAGSLDELDYYGSMPRTMVRGRDAVSLARTNLNHVKPAKTILRKPRVLNGGKFLLAERNIGYILGSLSLLGGYLFANQFYTEGFVTMIDPFQNLYGVRAGIILMIPVLIADILFAAVVLSSLGALLHTTLGFDHSFGVMCSLLSVLAYLLAGGLYAGTFTDAIQFVYLVIGLLLVTPFTLTRTRPSLTEKVPNWLGSVDGRRSGLYIDQFAVLILGGIPMQSYFQRILSSSAAKNVRTITVATSVGMYTYSMILTTNRLLAVSLYAGCLLNAVPAVLIGAAAKSADWVNTTLGASPSGENNSIVLPIIINEYVPSFALFMALGALASGLMASCDSAIFGSATMITHNLYRIWLRPVATEREIRWIARLVIFLISGIVLLLCLLWPHWHQHWILPYDILYVIVFPQIFCVIHYRYANTYGAMFALFIGTVFRLLFGETSIHLPAVWHLPFWTMDDGQLFPYRTFAMLISLLTLLFVSLLYHYLHYKGHVASPNDIFVCFAHESSKRHRRVTLEAVERTTVL